MKINIVLACAFIALIFLYGCTKQGDVGQSSLLNLITETPGPNCANGGIKVVSGVDANRNGILEDNEIQNVKYVCNASSDKQVIIYFPAYGVAYSTSSAAGIYFKHFEAKFFGHSMYCRGLSTPVRPTDQNTIA